MHCTILHTYQSIIFLEVPDTSTILSLITSNEETDEQIDEEQATGTEEVTIDDKGVDDSLIVTEVTEVKQSSNSTENSSNGFEDDEEDKEEVTEVNSNTTPNGLQNEKEVTVELSESDTTEANEESTTIGIFEETDEGKEVQDVNEIIYSHDGDEDAPRFKRKIIKIKGRGD